VPVGDQHPPCPHAVQAVLAPPPLPPAFHPCTLLYCLSSSTSAARALRCACGAPTLTGCINYTSCNAPSHLSAWYHCPALPFTASAVSPVPPGPCVVPEVYQPQP
jgi:hypothetical protein